MREIVCERRHWMGSTGRAAGREKSGTHSITGGRETAGAGTRCRQSGRYIGRNRDRGGEGVGKSLSGTK